jgi:hypothetical protein
MRKHAPDHGHGLLLDEVTVLGVVVPVPVVCAVVGKYLPVLDLPQLAPPRTFGGLRPLVLGELVEDAVGELALRALVASVVERPDLRTVLLELLAEEVVVGGLAREAVPILRQHHRNAASGHQVSHPVQAGTLEARPALTGV